MTRRNIWRRVLSVVLAVMMVGGVFISLGINSTAAISVISRDINGNILFPADMKSDCGDAWSRLFDEYCFACEWLEVEGIEYDEDRYDALCEFRVRGYFGMGLAEMDALCEGDYEIPPVSWYNLKVTVIALDVIIGLLAERSKTFPNSVLTAKANAERVLTQYESLFQAWLAEQKVTEPIATIPDGLYAIVGKASGKAITTGIADENGKECFILTYSPKDYTDQVFRFEKQPDGSYVIISNYDGRYLEVKGASLADGAPVQVWQNNGQSNIYWNIYSAGNGYYTIVNRNSGKAIDVYSGFTADYSIVNQWERNNTDAQLFRLERLDGGGAGETFKIRFIANGGTPQPAVRTAYYGQPLGTLPAPTKAGYQFAGWTTTINNTTQIVSSNTVINKGDIALNSNGETEFFGIWEEGLKDYKIKFDSQTYIDTKTGIKDCYVDICFGDSLFNSPATTYNQDLALTAAALSAAAIREQTSANTTDIRNALNTLQFNDVSHDNGNRENSYSIANSENDIKHRVAYTFARKEITSDGKKYNLIAIVVRGTANGGEWQSNFMLRPEPYGDKIPPFHFGFSSAMMDLLDGLDAYRSRYIKNDYPSKYFVTGHSRGAAVANLTARSLSADNTYATKENVYAYTFATPNVTSQSDVKNTSQYSNIFNFVNAEDLVPYLPLSVSGWDYWKYGKTFALNYEPSEQLKSAARAHFKRLTGRDDLLRYDGYAQGVQKFVSNLWEKAGKSENYYEDIWGYSSNTVVWNYGSPHKFFSSVASALNDNILPIIPYLVPFVDAPQMLFDPYFPLTAFLIYHGQITPDFRYGHAMDTYIACVFVKRKNNH